MLSKNFKTIGSAWYFCFSKFVFSTTGKLKYAIVTSVHTPSLVNRLCIGSERHVHITDSNRTDSHEVSVISYGKVKDLQQIYMKLHTDKCKFRDSRNCVWLGTLMCFFAIVQEVDDHSKASSFAFLRYFRTVKPNNDIVKKPLELYCDRRAVRGHFRNPQFQKRVQLDGTVFTRDGVIGKKRMVRFLCISGA